MGTETVQDVTSVHGIDLAREADFDLGDLRVHPARCEVEWNDATQVLQRRVMQVLVALAQSSGSVVSQDDLVALCWRGLSVSDDAIFRCIGKLRKLAAGYPSAPYAIETIPGVGYRLTSSSAGYNDRPTKASPLLRYRFGGAVAVAATGLVLALVLIAATVWIGRNRPAPPHPMRVAVLPFEALSSSPDARALARRVPNEIVDVLGDSQIEAVLNGEQGQSAASSSVSVPGIIVTGILQDDGRSTTADVRIVDGTSRAALWSAEFTRNTEAASDLPIEVAARVADVVSMINFARSAEPPLNDDPALSAVLQTNDMIRDTQGEDWAQMLARTQDIVARNPNFAFGHSLLAVAYGIAADNVGIPDRAKAMRDAARREANLTLKLDPQDAGAYAVLSGFNELTLGQREAILARGIKLAKHPKQPLAALYSAEAKLLNNAGRLNEALSFQLIAYATDEWGAPKTAQLARTYANLGNLAAATSWLQKGVRRWPNHSGVERVQRYVVGIYGKPADALSILNRLDLQRPSEGRADAVWRTFVQARSAHSPERTAAAARSVRKAADQNIVPREYEILMLAALGEPGQAIEVGNSALDQLRLESWILFTPVTRNVRQDSGFVSLASRLGLIQYWRETGKRPDFCTDPARRSECGPQLLAALKSN
jgi:DNA-binding winged helix-turn-helix (wHTH) protein/TolB-like protein